jgi:hypothetical protein
LKPSAVPCPPDASEPSVRAYPRTEVIRSQAFLLLTPNSDIIYSTAKSCGAGYYSLLDGGSEMVSPFSLCYLKFGVAP